MNPPSSRHLSHDFPAYKGLTLRELLVIVIVTTSTSFLLFALVGLLLGYAVFFGCLGFLTGFIFSVTVVPKPIARMKAGKPYGYLVKKTRLKAASLGLGQNPYLQHRGLWQKSKRFGGPRV